MADIVKEKLQEIKNVIEFKWNELKDVWKIKNFKTLDKDKLISKKKKTIKDTVVLIDIFLKEFFEVYDDDTKCKEIFDIISEAQYYLDDLENFAGYDCLISEENIENNIAKKKAHLALKIYMLLRNFRIVHSLFYNNETEREKNN